MTELPLVVGVDGSEPSLTAVDWAVDEAARRGLPLRLVYASVWERYEGGVPSGDQEPPSEQVLAERIVASAAARARQRSAEVRTATDILPQEPVAALLREGDEAFAVVTGTRGRGVIKGLLPGSVGLTVAARARCPVIVVRGDRAGLAGTHGRVLLGAGEPDTGGEAVRFAFQEAEARGCVLDAVRAWRRPALESAGRPLLAGDAAHRHERQADELLETLLRDVAAGHPGVRVQRATPEGQARKVLVDRSAAADLVVVGARRRAGGAGHRLGRVAHALLHHALCPVAVVPQR
ncbi:MULTISPECIES: universal stress protein [Streptomyces]|uniref:Universal stress protein n=2 Tax=Streptomyces TaxID=1883 RepID=A0ABS9JFX8_9ACTN|nr:universal stress protein [Streptomyces tricolor]MCG0064455.1 universal stress protein [Streptomyces tricolor]MYU27599.1 universal stress protein [Streptomyces sp. SID7810]CUW26460.1 Universal stress protein/MT2061 [Streptomyces reticuli]